MVNATYQLLVLGNVNGFHNLIISTLQQRIADLGLESDILEIIDATNFNIAYRQNAPAVGLYYGGTERKNLDMVEIIMRDANIVLPIYHSDNSFYDDIPDLLHPINGVKLASQTDVESIVSNILEGFSLLRISRRLFISYRRAESRGAAIQLFERLEMAGFDVFLDTHSIRKGDQFQDELWHRLVDTDVVVLLNTPEFLTSDWTAKELAKANSMSIGILQLIWPENSSERSAELSLPYQLADEDFEGKFFKNSNATFTSVALDNIVRSVEGLRARSLAARQDNISTEFIKQAALIGRNAILQREKYITITKDDDEDIVIIPTIGVPHAFSYHESEDLIKLIKSDKVKMIWILYDHINIREKWIKHLAWLDLYLPVRSLKVTEIEDWLNRN